MSTLSIHNGFAIYTSGDYTYSFRLNNIKSLETTKYVGLEKTKYIIKIVFVDDTGSSLYFKTNDEAQASHRMLLG